MSIRNKLHGLGEVLSFSNWIELICSLILFRQTGLKVYRHGPWQFICDHANGDENSIRKAVATPMYRDLLAQLDLRGPLRVIDIGANAGGFVALLLADGCRLERIWSVEMNPFTFHRLNFNVSHNLGLSGRACNVAIAGSTGQLKLRLGKGGTSASIFGSGSANAELSVVRAVTFDEFWLEEDVGESVDLCKIDIEGAEYEMIFSGRATQLCRCAAIVIEMHPVKGCSMDELARSIERLGFEVAVRPRAPYLGTTLWVFKKLNREANV